MLISFCVYATSDSRTITLEKRVEFRYASAFRGGSVLELFEVFDLERTKFLICCLCQLLPFQAIFLAGIDTVNDENIEIVTQFRGGLRQLEEGLLKRKNYTLSSIIAGTDISLILVIREVSITHRKIFAMSE